MAVLEQLDKLSDDRFLAIYTSLGDRGFGPLDGEVAKAMKFRPQAIKKLPMDRRAKKARGLIVMHRNAELCYELFGSYLVKTKRDLVTGFLDATGVEHEDGMIQNIDAAAPKDEMIAAAVKDLDQRFDPDDVTLYLALAVEQWPEVEKLTEAWKAR
ncbi:MAG: hypothetical protein CMJ89_18805 [Planctomycetes bacterium]|jgi:hypothetical protein|nr:hypothetical protein [Planctomycetota bacterium]